MHITNILKILGIVVLFYSLTMLPPILVALWYHENTILNFIIATMLTAVLGLLLWFPTRHEHRELRPREGFLIVTLIWVLLCIISTLPLLTYQVSFFDAIFEVTSGLTATGATVFTGLEDFPKSILYYRQQLQFIGGGGIILFAVAILPMLGVGGMQLIRAEMAGPFKEDKLTPRVAQTAKTLWYIYVGLVLICAFLFWLAGMTPFDAICHSFATVSTGGFSTHDQNFGFFQNPLIQYVAVVFMFLGAINFSLHFVAVRRKTLRHYWQDVEFRFYIVYLLIITGLVVSMLWYYNLFNSFETTFHPSIFQVTTFATTTGFASTDYSKFPSFLPILLILIGMVGGCAGSTAGGIKMIRAILMNKQGIREIERLIHPSGHYVIKLGYSRLQNRTLDAIWGFLGVYIAIFTILLLLLIGTGLDFISAFSGVAAAISSSGLGLGALSENFKALNDPAKLILTFAMLAGRLEFFTLLVLFSPSYWRH